MISNLMMSTLQRILIAGALLFTANSTCWAGLIKGDIVKFDRGTFGGGSGGGEFAMHKLVTSSSGESWQQMDVATFCLEFNEHIVLGQRLVVGAISDRAVLGGISGGSGFGDPLSAQTQFLYAAYASGQLSTAVGYTPSNAWADSMQEAVWSLEGEVTSLTKLHSQTLINYANTYSGPLLSNVFALNLFKSNVPIAALNAFDPSNRATWDAVAGYHRQDQLYYVAPSGSGAGNIPEPASLALWLTASLIASFSRFRRPGATG